MARHRFLEQIGQETRQLAAVPASSTGFMACPVAVQQLVGKSVTWQQGVYAAALAEAQAVARPSILDRLAAHLQN